MLKREQRESERDRQRRRGGSGNRKRQGTREDMWSAKVWRRVTRKKDNSERGRRGEEEGKRKENHPQSLDKEEEGGREERNHITRMIGKENSSGIRRRTTRLRMLMMIILDIFPSTRSSHPLLKSINIRKKLRLGERLREEGRCGEWG